MADLRIVDALEIPTENITGEEKLPTGGSGNYSISLDSLADYTKTKKDLADNASVDGKVNGVRQELDAHIEDLLNPHQVTKGQIGLGNVDNTADADKPVSNSTQSAIISAVAPKANKADVYTKQESSDLVNNSISTALTPVNFSLDLAKRGIANRYDPLLTYNSGQRVVLTNGDIVKSSIDANTNNPNTDLTGWVKVNSASQIFDESGKSQQEINSSLVDGYAYVEWFGDTSTDATNAINMCLLYCRNYNKTAKGIPNKTYTISDTIVIQSSCDFSKSKFETPSSLAKTAIQITNRGTGLTHIRSKSIKLPELTNNRELGVVPTVGSIGVQILGGMRNCDVLFDNIYGFEENLQLKSDTPNNDEFIAYNKFTFNGLIAGSKVNVHLWIANAGWVNQCTWIGGQFARYSQDQAAFDTVNLKVSKSTSTGNNPPNGHTFVGCAMEGAFTQTIEYVLHADISTSYFASNTFVNCRFEQATSMKFSPLALYDTFVGCYGLNEVAFVDEVRPTIIGSPRTGHLFLDIAAIVGATGSRTAKNTFMFAAGNSSSAMPLSVGFNKVITGGLQASGSYVMFHPTNAALLHPLVRIALDGGSPAILMGDGVTAPAEKLSRYAPNDWRHTFNLRPSTDLGSQLGTASNRYKELHVQDLSMYPPVSNTPTNNGEATFEFTSNNQLTVRAKGTDGVVRSKPLFLNTSTDSSFISITDFGAVGDGVADDSNAIQAALDTGKSVFIPETDNFWKVTRRMELKAIGQKVYGLGSKSLVKMVNALVCESVFRAADLGKNRFENVYAIPSVDGTLNWGGGVGFMIQRSHGSSVVNCEVSDHRGGGVSLLGSSYCYVSGNHIRDSVVVEDEEIGRWGNDITVNNGSFNIIDNNRCINGCGIGIAVQNLVETDISNSNKITNNIVKDQPVYGIILYKKAAADQILRNEICGNTVENITGSIREPLGYAYGCGIYIQTAEHSIVDGNTVRDAMGRSKDGTTPYEIHTPAGIGIANVANAIVTNNKVIDSGWYGIQAISSIALSARGAGIKISDNDVQGSNRIGIYVQDVPKTAISGNTVNQKTGSQAVLVRQNVLNQSVFALVSNNELYSDGVCFESSGGIKLVKLDDNTIEGTAAGYSVQLDGVRVEAVGNYIDPSVAAASGVRIGANVVTGLVDDNDIVKGNIGIGYANATTGNMFIGDKNRNNASIPFHNGTSQSMWRPLANSATPSVQGINLAIQNNATNITNLTGSVLSQRVILKAGVAFTLVNGATMKLSGGTNFAMATGNLITLFNDDGVWREESRSLTA